MRFENSWRYAAWGRSVESKSGWRSLPAIAAYPGFENFLNAAAAFTADISDGPPPINRHAEHFLDFSLGCAQLAPCLSGKSNPFR
jgi:hypothetical protein